MEGGFDFDCQPRVRGVIDHFSSSAQKLAPIFCRVSPHARNAAGFLSVSYRPRAASILFLNRTRGSRRSIAPNGARTNTFAAAQNYAASRNYARVGNPDVRFSQYQVACRGISGSSSDASSSIEKLFAPVLVWQSQPGFRVSNFSSAIRNLVAAAARKHEIDTETAEIRVDADESVSTLPIKFKAANTGGGISTPSVTASRFTGFTQSETSAAWCGNSVLVAFNDTAAEITTLAGGSGISSIGFSNSSNLGSKFSYLGAPTVAASALQMLAGDPVVVCADAKTFYYSSTWMDGMATVSGIAVAQSTDGGATFSAPTPAVAMPSSSHIISRGWLTIDSSRPSHLYLAYDDFDFSGAVCGSNISGQANLGYAVELVSSTDGANTWSAPVVVEEVCQDSVSPSASVLNPQAVVDQHGTVYVVWEAIGEDGGTLTTREIKVASSTTEGASFSAPVEIAAVTPIGNGADLQSFIH
jgi:hypothetical protein